MSLNISSMVHTLRLSLVHKERAGDVNHFTAALQLRPCNTETLPTNQTLN